MGVSIRAATVGDVPGILPMVQQVCDFHARMDPVRFDFEPGVSERYRAWLQERATDPKSVLLVAESQVDWYSFVQVAPDAREPSRSIGVSGRDGPLVGFIVGSVEANIPVYTTKSFAMLHDLWVEPDSRGRGVGRALVIEALRRFERIGAKQVRGETAAGNDAARQMLAGLGFRVGAIELLHTFGA